ncbi:MAG: DinB family protein [Phycisphaerae bacterium]
MFERENNVCAFTLAYAARLLGDVTDDRMAFQPSPHANPPAWILGHLAVVADFGLEMLGQSRRCNAAWHKAFSPGSDSSAGEFPVHDKATLLAAIDGGYKALMTAAAKANDAALAKRIDMQFFKDTPIQTVGDLITHMLTSHMSLHLGQLSAWRRTLGYAPLF